MTQNAPALNVKLFVLQTVCQAQKLKLVIRLLPHRLHLMDRLSRPEFVLHLRALGEETPEARSKLEIRQRIRELRVEQPTLAATDAQQAQPQECNAARVCRGDLGCGSIRHGHHCGHAAPSQRQNSLGVPGAWCRSKGIWEVLPAQLSRHLLPRPKARGYKTNTS